MKTFIKLTITFCVLMFALIITPNISNAQSLVISGKVIYPNVNMKQQPESNSTTLKAYNVGDKIEIIGNKNLWLQIKDADGITGWMDSSYVVPIKDIEYFKKGIVTCDVLNVRQNASITSSIVSKKNMLDTLNIVDKENEWYKILLEDSAFAYVHSDYVKLISLYPMWTISKDSTNLKKSFSEESETITQLKANTPLFVLDRQNDWFQVSTGDDIIGWVKNDLISPTTNQKEVSINSRGTDERITTNLVNIAKQYLGSRYVWGASGPKTFDCSGFTQFVYNKMSISIPRTSRTQGKYGKYVSRSELIPGDLIFFDTSGVYNKVITHCGIYIGSGKFIHASSSKSKMAVTISSLNTGYYNSKYVVARRPY